MTTTDIDIDVLADWATRQQHHTPRPSARHRGTLRFTLYGRMSTKDRQDPVASRRWQHFAADDLITGHGHIVSAYFDAGCSRRIPWNLRPEAAALLAAIADPDRDFDAIVVGEYERAFIGGQHRDILPLLEQHGIQLWLPEIGGPVDPNNEQQMALLDTLGVDSRREITRARYRTTIGMLLHVNDGRHLGGRPPYGYQLAPAEPHSNALHARWGRRIHRLQPDPNTAPHIRWIFQQRLDGHSTRDIADDLNERGIPCPSAADPERNPHRHHNRWTARTIASILANPRYTGRQVWNRQPSHHTTDTYKIRSWAPPTGWAISAKATHDALVSEADFVRIQQTRKVPQPADGSQRTYLLAGLVFCGTCQRPMQSHWANGRPGYRCRHGHHRTSQHRALYIREDQLLQQLRRLAHQEPLPDFGDPTSVADYLRNRHITITCRPGNWQLKTPTRVHHLRPHHRQEPLIAACGIPRERATSVPAAPRTIPGDRRPHTTQPSPPT